jgi:superfamily II DNA helicase RecQ
MLFASRAPAFKHKANSTACTEAAILERKVKKKAHALSKQRLGPDDLELAPTTSNESRESVNFAVKSAAALQEKKGKKGEADLDDEQEPDDWSAKRAQLLEALCWTKDLSTEAQRAELVGFLPWKDPVKKYACYPAWKAVDSTWKKQLGFAEGLPGLAKWVVAEGPGKPKLIWKKPRKELTLERRRDLFFCLLYFMHQKQGGGEGQFDAQAIQGKVFRGRVEGGVDTKMDIEVFVMAMLSQKGHHRKGGHSEIGIASASSLDKMIKDLIWLLQTFALNNLSIREGQLDYEEGQFVNELCLGFNAYTCLKNIQNQTAKVLKASRNEAGVLTKVVPKDAVGTCVFVQGEPIEADFLPSTFQVLIKCIKEKMAWLAGVDNVDTDLQLKFDHVLDDLTTTNVQSSYYGFLFVDSNVPADKSPTTCWERILDKHPNLTVQGKESFSATDSRTWVKEADFLIQLLLVALHIGGGGPARGTELELLSFSNSVERQRSMFVIDGSVCTVLSVPKSEQLAGGMKKPIPRKLEPSLGLLLLKYMVYLRSPHHLLSHSCFVDTIGPQGNKEKRKEDLQRTFWHHFLVHRGKRGTADWITLTFRDILKKVMHTNMTFSSYRHYAQFVGSNYLMPLALYRRDLLMRLDAEELRQAWGREECLVQMLILPVQHHLTLQGGHAIQTADQQYALNPISHAAMPWVLMKKFLHVSNVWHELLLSTSIKNELVLMQVATSSSKGGSAEPLMYPWICSVDPYSTVCFKDNIGAPCKASIECHPLSEECLAFGLKAGFGVSSFKSPHQKLAVERVLGIFDDDDDDDDENVLGVETRVIKEDTNVLVVLPTGGGKSLVAFFPPILDIMHYRATKGLTVVVSPLISLRDSQISKLLNDERLPQPACVLWQELLGNARLQVSFYQHHHVRTTVLFLFVTAEACQTEKFQTFYKVMTGLNRITRVVVDEAHNLVCSSSYRDAYKNIAFLLQPSLLHGGGGGGDDVSGGGEARGEKEAEQKKRKTAAAAESVVLVRPKQRIPCTLLSATIPVAGGFEENLFDTLGIPSTLDLGHGVEVVRAPVVTRSELTLGVQEIEGGKKSLDPLYDAVCCAVTNYLFPVPGSAQVREGCQSHILVYVHSLEACGKLQQKLEKCFAGVKILQGAVRSFNGKMDTELKLEVGEWWFESGPGTQSAKFLPGKPPKILVATTAFGEGLDHPAVGLVIHCGLAYSLINLLQEMGRAARSPEHVETGMALYLHHQSLYESMVENSEERAALQEVFNGFVQAGLCRWEVFGSAFDNVHGKTCATIGSKLMCDLCCPRGTQHWSEGLLSQAEMRGQLDILKGVDDDDAVNQGDGLLDQRGVDWAAEYALLEEQDPFAYDPPQVPSTPLSAAASGIGSSDVAATPSPNPSIRVGNAQQIDADHDLYNCAMQWKNWVALNVVAYQCWVCGKNHSWEKCQFWYNKCCRCYQKGHFVKQCSKQKPTEPVNVICFSCYLPFDHCIHVPGHGKVKFPVDPKKIVCAEKILRPILMLGVFLFGEFDGKLDSFEKWYLDSKTTWVARFQYIMRLTGNFPINNF